MASGEPMRVPSGLILLMAVQLVCAAFFVADAVQDYREEGGLASLDWHLAFETLATLSLFIAIANFLGPDLPVSRGDETDRLASLEG